MIFEGLWEHVFQVSLADLQNDKIALRKFKLIAEDVQGKKLPNFQGMDLNCAKMYTMVKRLMLTSRLLMIISFICSVLLV
jgi:small subunit ribosomal protein S3Ae